MPEHKHVMPYTTGNGASAGVGYKLGTSETQSWSSTLTTGAGKAHNNMPPYIVQIVHVKSWCGLSDIGMEAYYYEENRPPQAESPRLNYLRRRHAEKTMNEWQRQMARTNFLMYFPR